MNAIFVHELNEPDFQCAFSAFVDYVFYLFFNWQTIQYTILITMLTLLEAALVAFILIDRRWEKVTFYNGK